MANVQTLRKTLVSLCAILLLVCIFLSVMPHEHGCCQLHCPICSFFSRLGELVLLFTITTALAPLLVSVCVLADCFCRRAPVTLVGLKVKLSN